ncbi:hypothetical protein [Acidicapsa ligni]|uniref:hypothetical protein n=1 Tax=Acidicapsa ligni TaxID=542300 RepID=UPI0021E0DB89|nr:hypothetical protein [Acidicapsa ligni]
MQALHKIDVTLEMIKREHSIFAQPFALTAAMLSLHQSYALLQHALQRGSMRPPQILQQGEILLTG